MHRESRFQDLCQTLHEMDGFPEGSSPAKCGAPSLSESAVGRLRHHVADFANPPRDLLAPDGKAEDISFSASSSALTQIMVAIPEPVWL